MPLMEVMVICENMQVPLASRTRIPIILKVILFSSDL